MGPRVEKVRHTLRLKRPPLLGDVVGDVCIITHLSEETSGTPWGGGQQGDMEMETGSVFSLSFNSFPPLLP